jgi:class 3 adenylate cyclase
VLFADLIGSTQLYERVGDSAAYRLVDRSLSMMQQAVENKRGRIVKHTGDGLMAVFDHADDAADAALAMHAALRDVPGPGGQRLAVRIGFNFGSVIEGGQDLFGETVNFAARLAELATAGRALTTAETREKLSAHWRDQLNALPPRVLRGASWPVELFELKCESLGDITVLQSTPFELDDTSQELQLRLGDKVIVVDNRRPVVRLGRATDADINVCDSLASRKHAEIELRGDKFVLIDRSSNGTYVHIEGEKEFLLNREEAVLHGRGQLALGGSCQRNPCAISFVCS